MRPPRSPRFAALALALAPALCLVACQAFDAPSPAEVGLWPDAAGSTRNDMLAKLLDEGWEGYLRAHPEFASYLGDARFNGQLTNRTPEAKEARRAELWGLQERFKALDQTKLDGEDQLSARLFGELIQEELDELTRGLDEWSVDPLGGPQAELLSRAVDQPARTAREREQLLERWSTMALVIRRQGDALRRGLSRGHVAPAVLVDKTIAQIDRILGTPYWDSPLLVSAAAGGRWVPLGNEETETLAGIASREYGDGRKQDLLRRVNQRFLRGDLRALGTRILIPAKNDTLEPDERGRFLGAVYDRIELEIYPALAFYRSLLEREIRPVARSDEKTGLVWLPGGAALYAELARYHTGLPKTPQEIHGYGLGRLDAINREMVQLAERLWGTRDFAALRAKVEGDPALYFQSGAEILASAQAALRRAELAVPAVFRDLPAARCLVTEIPAHEAPDSTTAYYQPPSLERGLPGRYYVNTFAPNTRPRYEAEALAFHEAVPGHHTQIAIAAERGDLPAFRRHLGSTAYVEGWALYAEELADELGLYSDDLQRLGKLSYQAWRAARLVVDTGLHNDGWSRAQALAFMREHTLLSQANIENEVDRYIAWPGQALAYELGAAEIKKLRATAKASLGAGFSLADFHREVLRHGALPLPLLGEQIDRWILAR
jgi:uncharacterized protein (DUF885 family)